MKGLERVFMVKIVVTVLFWAGPLLLVPAEHLVTAGLPDRAIPLARLLGFAYAALCVGYVSGLREVRAGGRAASAIAVGIVSNGGAGAYLTYCAVTGAWAGWQPIVRMGATVSAVLTLGIALGLYWFGLRAATVAGDDDAGNGATS